MQNKLKGILYRVSFVANKHKTTGVLSNRYGYAFGNRKI